MSVESNILIIDDDAAHARAISEGLERTGHRLSIATSGKEGLKLLQKGDIDVVVTDLVMHDVDGMEILREAKKTLPDAEVIFITGYGTVETAVKAMQEGAFTFLLKPVNIQQLRATIKTALQRQELLRNNRQLQMQLEEKFGFSGIIGSSARMHKIFDTLRQIAPTNATTLIIGESGTGKELIAKAIHYNSPRRNHPFVVLNSAAITETLLESELFGHEKGAFTGATYQRKGKFEYASGGSLFLDEVGDMPLSTQAKLLRVIEDGKITRVGSNEPISVNVRIITATNQDIEKLIQEGKFRKDLYFRLNVVCIKLPPLRERQEDIPLLIDVFVKEFAAAHGKKIKGLSPNARKLLLAYTWPGNVRELKNCVESMVVVSRNSYMDVGDIPEHILKPSASGVQGSTNQHISAVSLAEMEKELIKNALEMAGGNREKSARRLGIGERTLYRKIERYGLK